MQFGRYHGIVLAALGFLLICLQVIIGSAKPPHATDATSTKTVEHKTTIVPGAIGGGLFVVGLFFVIIARRGDQPPSERALK